MRNVCFATLTLLVLSICGGCTSHYVTTFAPEQEPSRTLNMNYEGYRANIAVGDFTVKARGAIVFGKCVREQCLQFSR